MTDLLWISAILHSPKLQNVKKSVVHVRQSANRHLVSQPTKLVPQTFLIWYTAPPIDVFIVGRIALFADSLVKIARRGVCWFPLTSCESYS